MSIGTVASVCLARRIGMVAVGRTLADDILVQGTNVFAGGFFSTAGGVFVNFVAKWNGSTWSSLGAGVGPAGSIVQALAWMNNKLYVTGRFSTAGGVLANSIAAWDGTNWMALGSGIADESIARATSMTVLGSDLYVGGTIGFAGTRSSWRIARWNESVDFNPALQFSPFTYSGGQFQFGVSANAVEEFAIERSSNLSNWTEIARSTTSTNVTDAAAIPAQFYRARQTR
ncbi:MAG: hypothetical protein JWO95_2929 [Verrucomicrobiales bacterium]|nr:hypothetical protein [Verrucomicrobiales bacterium]